MHVNTRDTGNIPHEDYFKSKLCMRYKWVFPVLYESNKETIDWKSNRDETYAQDTVESELENYEKYNIDIILTMHNRTTVVIL